MQSWHCERQKWQRMGSEGLQSGRQRRESLRQASWYPQTDQMLRRRCLEPVAPILQFVWPFRATCDEDSWDVRP